MGGGGGACCCCTGVAQQPLHKTWPAAGGPAPCTDCGGLEMQLSTPCPPLCRPPGMWESRLWRSTRHGCWHRWAGSLGCAGPMWVSEQACLHAQPLSPRSSSSQRSTHSPPLACLPAGGGAGDHRWHLRRAHVSLRYQPRGAGDPPCGGVLPGAAAYPVQLIARRQQQPAAGGAGAQHGKPGHSAPAAAAMLPPCQ